MRAVFRAILDSFVLNCAKSSGTKIIGNVSNSKKAWKSYPGFKDKVSGYSENGLILNSSEKFT